MGRFHADHNARHSLVNRHGSLVVRTFILVSSVSIDAADIISNRACRSLASSSRSNRRSFFPPFAARNVTKKSDRDYTPRGKRREHAHRIQSIDRFDYSIIETRRALKRNRFACRKMKRTYRNRETQPRSPFIELTHRTRDFQRPSKYQIRLRFFHVSTFTCCTVAG